MPPSDDLELGVSFGYRHSPFLFSLFVVLSVLTLGLLPLACLWFPSLLVRLTHRRCALSLSTSLILPNSDVCRVSVVPLPYSPESPDDSGPVRIAEYHCFRYFYDPCARKFLRLKSDLEGRSTEYAARFCSKGLSRQERVRRLVLFGRNETPIPKESLGMVVMRRILHPFVVFQLGTVVLWVFEVYWSYAVFIILSTAVVVVVNVRDIRKETESRNSWIMKRSTTRVLLAEGTESLRRGEVVAVDSSELVPGDVVVVGSEMKRVPCDMLLLTGSNVVVSESNLTGKSEAVVKTPVCPRFEEAAAGSSKGSHAAIASAAQGTAKAAASGRRCVLLCGTDVLCLKDPSLLTKAVVVRTGFDSNRGRLVRSVIHPSSSGSPSNSATRSMSDSWRFMFMLFGLSAIGAIWSAVNSVLHGENFTDTVSYSLDLITLAIPPELPLLIMLGANQALSTLKKRFGVFCLDPLRINDVGRLQVMALDKTGTITEETLEVLGVAIARNDVTTSRLVLTEPQTVELGNAVSVLACCHSLKAVASGDEYDDEEVKEGVQVVAKEVKLVGDHMDLLTFKTSRWKLEERTVFGKTYTVVRPPAPLLQRTGLCLITGTEAGSFGSVASSHRSSSSYIAGTSASRSIDIKRHEDISNDGESEDEVVRVGMSGPLGSSSDNLDDEFDEALTKDSPLEDGSLIVVRRFEYESESRRELVVARRYSSGGGGDSGSLNVMCKGAPEVVERLCHPATLPYNYASLIKRLTLSEGYRVLALAGRDFVAEDLPLSRVEEMPREFWEADLEFRGLLVLRNPVKQDAALVVANLAHAGIVPIMITGDNLNTAVAVSRAVGIVPPEDEGKRGSRLFFGELSNDGAVRWNPPGVLDPVTLAPYNWDGVYQYDLAVTGDAYAAVASSESPALLKQLLSHCRTFGRMKPRHKQAVIEAHRSELGNVVGMCGDGANDAAALKSADIGIALSPAVSSAATFSASRLSDVLQIVREGLAALEMTLKIFKFMCHYSLLGMSAVAVLYIWYVDLGDWTWFYLDLVLTIPLSFSISFLSPPEAAPGARIVLPRHKPSGKLMNMGILVSIFAQYLLQMLFLSFVLVVANNTWWYVVPSPGWGESVYNTHPTAVVFLYANFQYVVCFLVVIWDNRPEPQCFHKRAYKVKQVVGFFVLATSFNCFLLFQDIDFVNSFLDLPYGSNPTSASSSSLSNDLEYGENPSHLPMRFKVFLLVVAAFDALASLLLDRLLKIEIPRMLKARRRILRDSSPAPSCYSSLASSSSSVSPRVYRPDHKRGKAPAREGSSIQVLIN